VTYDELRGVLEPHEQGNLLRFWDSIDDAGRAALSAQIEQIDFPLVERLTGQWIRSAPEPEAFARIEPVKVVPKPDADDLDAQKALQAGEEALAAGRVGLVLVAGGQGTRLGFDGPKGAYPIGPITRRSLFAYHADKIHSTQRRYGCTLPWYIMVGESNEIATRAFFDEHDFFGLDRQDVVFFKQRMMPCVGEDGRFFLEAKDRVAMNPNGHGGSIPAMVENGITADARGRGIDTLSYFQVDNFAVKVADPYFIGHHVLGNAEFSAKAIRKREAREAAGVFCVCDGQTRVIEYTELDIYPELLETDSQGELLHFAINPAIHILSVEFVEHVFAIFDSFPWHCSHKAIPHLDEAGETVNPSGPNGYKFETFVFDALGFATHEPVILEIDREGEFTPTKKMEGVDSVASARAMMRAMWAEWLEAAGWEIPRDGNGAVSIEIEINPAFAFSKEEFLEKARALDAGVSGDIVVTADGVRL
jgi:UDP-N-acetylglucosamine/UDP-N-acetylgalactosamine diphosphorylase